VRRGVVASSRVTLLLARFNGAHLGEKGEEEEEEGLPSVVLFLSSLSLSLSLSLRARFFVVAGQKFKI
jgi:hypothetical protein